MYHSFFATALLILSNAAVHAQGSSTITADPHKIPTTGTPPGVNEPTSAGTPPGNTPPTLPPAVPVQCTATFLPFSERDLAEMAKSEPTPGNQNSTMPDPATLSNVPTSAFCKNDSMTAVCSLDSCKLRPETTTECVNCHEYIINAAGDDGTVRPEDVGTIQCTESYNLNKTDTKTPFICANKEQSKVFSCKACSKPRFCDTCYDVKALAPSS
ncbi:uncharacterized protein VP01_1124g6 [Puccinia sorghi]|uniref:Uncharacterized protein n=1 Tax=Puccinia sorghi TaxID=27349 RepID=A0A0L6VS98_9BASI|nr:uncharacterized protein VP01_1124g6 [Puccinia sorghi]